MNTTVHEIAPRIYRLSTCVPEAAPGGFTFNQFLVDADEPIDQEAGMRTGVDPPCQFGTHGLQRIVVRYIGIVR